MAKTAALRLVGADQSSPYEPTIGSSRGWFDRTPVHAEERRGQQPWLPSYIHLQAIHQSPL